MQSESVCLHCLVFDFDNRLSGGRRQSAARFAFCWGVCGLTDLSRFENGLKRLKVVGKLLPAFIGQPILAIGVAPAAGFLDS